MSCSLPTELPGVAQCDSPQRLFSNTEMARAVSQRARSGSGHRRRCESNAYTPQPGRSSNVAVSDEQCLERPSEVPKDHTLEKDKDDDGELDCRRPTSVFEERKTSRSNSANSSFSSGSLSTGTSDGEERGFDNLFFRVITKEAAAVAAEDVALPVPGVSALGHMQSPSPPPSTRLVGGRMEKKSTLAFTTAPTPSRELDRLRRLQEAGRQVHSRKTMHGVGRRHHSTHTPQGESTKSAVCIGSPLSPIEPAWPSRVSSPAPPPPRSGELLRVPLVDGKVQVPALPRYSSQRNSPHTASVDPLRHSTGTWTTTHTNRAPAKSLSHSASLDSYPVASLSSASVGELRTRTREYAVLGHDQHTGLLRSSSVVEVEELPGVVRRPVAVLEQVSCYESIVPEGVTTQVLTAVRSLPHPPALTQQSSSGSGTGLHAEAATRAVRSAVGNVLPDATLTRGQRRQKKHVIDIDDGEEEEEDASRTSPAWATTAAASSRIGSESPLVHTQPSVRLRQEAEARFSATFSGVSSRPHKVLYDSWTNTPSPLLHPSAHHVVSDLDTTPIGHRSRKIKHHNSRDSSSARGPHGSVTRVPGSHVLPQRGSRSLPSIDALTDADDAPRLRGTRTRTACEGSATPTNTTTPSRVSPSPPVTPSSQPTLLANTPILDISDLLGHHTSSTTHGSAAPAVFNTSLTQHDADADEASSPLPRAGDGEPQQTPDSTGVTPELPSMALSFSLTGMSQGGEGGGEVLPWASPAQGLTGSGHLPPRSPQVLALARTAHLSSTSPPSSAIAFSQYTREPPATTPAACRESEPPQIAPGVFVTRWQPPTTELRRTSASASPLFPDESEEEVEQRLSRAENPGQPSTSPLPAPEVLTGSGATSSLQDTDAHADQLWSIPSPPNHAFHATTSGMLPMSLPPAAPAASQRVHDVSQLAGTPTESKLTTLRPTHARSDTVGTMGLSGSGEDATSRLTPTMTPTSQVRAAATGGQLLRFAPVDLTGSVRLLNISHNSSTSLPAGSFSLSGAAPAATTPQTGHDATRDRAASPAYGFLPHASPSPERTPLAEAQILVPSAGPTGGENAWRADFFDPFSTSGGGGGGDGQNTCRASAMTPQSDQSPLSVPLSPHRKSDSIRVTAIPSPHLGLTAGEVGVAERALVSRMPAAAMRAVVGGPHSEASRAYSEAGGPLSSVDSDPLCPGDMDEHPEFFADWQGGRGLGQRHGTAPPDGLTMPSHAYVSGGVRNVSVLSGSTTSRGSSNPLNPDDDMPHD